MIYSAIIGLVINTSREDLQELVRAHVKKNVYEAFKKVDRKLFVPNKFTAYAYSDEAIRLDEDSSISQPSLVAQMIDLLDLKGDEHILEIGTGSGYSSAILSLCCRKVNTIEIKQNLAKSAKKRLKKSGFENITVQLGDGSLGLPKAAPFDGIIVTAAARQMPNALIDQLKVGGKIVIPVETRDPSWQELVVGIKKKDGLVTKPVNIVRFVPLVKSKR